MNEESVVLACEEKLSNKEARYIGNKLFPCVFYQVNNMEGS